MAKKCKILGTVDIGEHLLKTEFNSLINEPELNHLNLRTTNYDYI